MENGKINYYSRLLIGTAELEKHAKLNQEDYRQVYDILGRPLKNVFSAEMIKYQLEGLIKKDYPGSKEEAVMQRIKDYIKLYKYAERMNKKAESSIRNYISFNDPSEIYKLLNGIWIYSSIDNEDEEKKYPTKSEKDEVLKEINSLLIQEKSFHLIVTFLLIKCQSDNTSIFYQPTIRNEIIKKALKI